MSYTSVTRKQPKAFYFSRAELSIILSAYATRVSNSDWRDYALDHIANCAIFSILWRSHFLVCSLSIECKKLIIFVFCFLCFVLGH